MGLLRRFAPRNDSKQVNRLRNKCAMTCVGKKVLSLGRELERGCNYIDNTILEPSHKERG